MSKRPKTTLEQQKDRPQTSSEQKDRPAAPQVPVAWDPLEQELDCLHHAALDNAEANRNGYDSDDVSDGMLVDAV